MSRILVLASVAAIVSSSVGRSSSDSPQQGRPQAAGPVVMISIDGLSPDYVLEADNGLRIPTLRRFVIEGVSATGVRGVFPTVTYPSHATLLSGVSPARHGIVANTTFDPFQKNDGGWYWYTRDVRVPTLWDAARDAGLVVASIHWPVSVGANVRYNIPQIWRRGTPDDRKLLEALATPGLMDTLERELGPYADGIDESIEGDENRARFAAKLFSIARPDFMTAYFTALDHEQHATGPHSKAANSTLERIDALLARLIAAIDSVSKKRARYVIVSDHGHLATDREVAPMTEFRRRGWATYASDTATTPSDWRAILWNSTGSGAIMLKDTSDAALRREVGEYLRALASDTANGINGVLTADSAARLGAFPGAAWVISMRAPYRLSSRSRGALVQGVRGGGTHGFGPDHPGIDAAFFALGPGIPRANLGRIDMRAIAPTVANLLGVRLPIAETKALSW
jgi:predicted AlkP superfamily pyrophosphatase or phosphodiesterase